MFAKRILLPCILGSLVCFALTLVGHAGDAKKTDKKVEKKKEVWTDPEDPTLPVDFKFQGEYAASTFEDKFVKGDSCQVIALGGGTFQAVVYKGGLPGAGWDGKNRSVMDGKLMAGEGDAWVWFQAATGKRKYLAQSPQEFSATAKFPPVGQRELSAKYPAKRGFFELNETMGDTISLLLMKKITRTSPTLGAKPPEGAVVLFDGSSKDEWNGGRVDKKTGFLNTDGNDITTKRKFSSYTAHVEFMIPFMPTERDQRRGNSGFYQVDQYEVQILDSFGLEGKHNECGGIYGRKDCKLNMCLPPLQWQTYDVEFTNAVREGDKLLKKSRITVRLNGVVIHDDYEISGVTGGARALDKKRDEPEGTPGVLRLQGHGNPVQFKNIWVVEKK